MIETLQDYRRQGRFALHAFVIMPDHIHVLLTPAPDVSLEKAVQFIKGGFSFRLRSGRPVWERSFNETQILSGDKFGACKEYILRNPIRKGLASWPAEYRYSSAQDNDVDPMPRHLQKP
jgi:putative transposase